MTGMFFFDLVVGLGSGCWCDGKLSRCEFDIHWHVCLWFGCISLLDICLLLLPIPIELPVPRGSPYLLATDTDHVVR